MEQAISIPITVHYKPSEPAILPVKRSGGFAYEKDGNATLYQGFRGQREVKIPL